MIYGYEQPVLYNPVEVFNPVTANMVLQSMGQYADVLQREHERALQEEKEFLKEYGDFSSAVPGATEAFYNESVGKVRNALAIALQNGIDLTRSPEGRAVLSRIINSVNIGKLNLLKQQKEAYDLFLKSANEALLKGDATPEYINALLEQYNLNGFSAIKNNAVLPWTLTSVPKYEGVDAFSDRIFGDIKNTYLGQEGAFDYSGVGTKQMNSALAISLPNYLNSPSGKYEMLKFLSVLPNNGADLTDEQKVKMFGDDIMNRAAYRYSHTARELNPVWEMNEEQRLKKDMYDYRGSIGDDGHINNSNSSYDGVQNSYPNGDNTEYGYSTQVRIFNEGLANLLQKKVEVINEELKSNTNALYEIAKNLSDVISKHTDENSKVNIEKVLADLSITKSINLVAQILGLSLSGDEDKQSNMYSFKKEELNHVITADYLATRLLGSEKSINAPSSANNVKKIIQKYSKYSRNEIKAVPTGHIVTYLSKDYAIRLYAKIHLMASAFDANGNTTKHDDDFVYIDLGTRSTLIKNKNKEGKRSPIAIDRNLSTLRDYEFEQIDKSVSLDQTKSIKTAYNN